MIGIKYLSNDFHENESYKLSSFVSGDNLFLSISSLKDNKLLGVKEFRGLSENYYFSEKEISKIFNDKDIINLNISQISIGFSTRDISIVPNSLLSDNSKENEILSNSLKKYNNQYTILKKKIRSIDASSFFPFPKALLKYAKDNFKSSTFCHINDPLIEQANRLFDDKDFILANLNEYQLQTIVFKNGNFVQSNIYDIKTKDDVLYYILLNLKNNAIPINIGQVYLSGRVQEDSAVHSLLTEHIKNIDFVKHIKRSNMSNIFLGKPKHIFFDLYSLSLCE